MCHALHRLNDCVNELLTNNLFLKVREGMSGWIEQARADTKGVRAKVKETEELVSFTLVHIISGI